MTLAGFTPLLSGLRVTVVFALIAFLLSAVVALVLVSLHRFAGWRARSALEMLTGFIITTPLVVQLFFLFYVAPSIGVLLSAEATGLACFALHFGSYMARTCNAALTVTAKGQQDAASALGLRQWQSYALIELPQAVIATIPQYGSYFTLLVKETALLSVITIPDLAGVVIEQASRTFRYTQLFTILALTYLVLTLLGTSAFSVLDRRFSYARPRS